MVIFHSYVSLPEGRGTKRLMAQQGGVTKKYQELWDEVRLLTEIYHRETSRRDRAKKGA